MTAAVETLSISGLKAMSTDRPMPIKQKVSILECSLSLTKLIMVPAMAQSHTNRKSDHPQLREKGKAKGVGRATP